MSRKTGLTTPLVKLIIDPSCIFTHLDPFIVFFRVVLCTQTLLTLGWSTHHLDSFQLRPDCLHTLFFSSPTEIFGVRVSSVLLSLLFLTLSHYSDPHFHFRTLDSPSPFISSPRFLLLFVVGSLSTFPGYL